MRSVVLSTVIAVGGGMCGALLSQSDTLFASAGNDLPPDPAINWSTPAIAGYGKVHYDASSAFQPSRALSNKVVFKVSRGSADHNQVNPALDHVAQVVNTYVAAGVPAQELTFVVAVNGDATSAMLENSRFRQLFGVDNPNLALISALEKQGVKVTVCDQALAWHHYQPQWIADSVIHTPSALTTVSTLQNQGYALLNM